MPMWQIYHPPGAFSAADKAAIATAATAMCTSVGLPAYYVHTMFIPVPAEDYFNAGAPRSHFVTVGIEHLARSAAPDDHAAHTRVKDAVDRILRPFVGDRGLHLEYNVFESHPFMWRIEGIDPPESFGKGDEDKAEASKALLDAKFAM